MFKSPQIVIATSFKMSRLAEFCQYLLTIKLSKWIQAIEGSISHSGILRKWIIIICIQYTQNNNALTIIEAALTQMDDRVCFKYLNNLQHRCKVVKYTHWYCIFGISRKLFLLSRICVKSYLWTDMDFLIYIHKMH